MKHDNTVSNTDEISITSWQTTYTNSPYFDGWLLAYCSPGIPRCPGSICQGGKTYVTCHGFLNESSAEQLQMVQIYV